MGEGVRGHAPVGESHLVVPADSPVAEVVDAVFTVFVDICLPWESADGWLMVVCLVGSDWPLLKLDDPPVFRAEMRPMTVVR